MSITLDLEDAEMISTYGGEDKSLEFSYYGLQFDDVYLTISPEKAVELYEKLGRHLRICGRIL